MLNHLHAKVAALGLTAGDSVAQTASQCFDISVWQFLAPLMVGGRVQIYPDEVAHDPSRLLAAIGRDRVTILETVPSLLRAMLEPQPGDSRLPELPALRWLIPTGEALSPELCRRWLQRYPRIPLMNAYGPTECSDDVTHHPIAAPPPADAVRVPIGRPIAELRVYVLDARLEPVPIGVAGELYVGGAGVGRGYLNDAARTAESFVPDPFGETPGARMYKTGDRGRYLSDGTIEFLGRVDHQVKLRGNRIETGEIEMLLRRHPAVVDALVLVREDTPGDPRLVAYLVIGVRQAPATAELAAFLRERLPAYMVPAAFVLLEALPLTRNGKVDRRALPAPVYGSTSRAQALRAPRDDLERRLVAIWEQVLDVRPIGVDGDFFELGGHSILAVRLMAQIEQAFGRRRPLATLFERTTVEQLALLLRNNRERAWSSLVPVQPNGAKRPFFCVHPGGGHVMAYQPLAHLLADRPFYGLQAVGIDGQAEPLADFEVMAARYLAELRQVQPEGPYLLGGWCTGGRIAHEMACQLEDQGERVALLVYFDATPEAEGMPGPETLPDDAALLASMSPAFLRYEAELRRLPAEQRLPRLVAQLQQAGAVPPDVGLEQILNILAVYRAIVRAEQTHAPRHYGGRITLFRAEQRPPDRGPDLGWRRSATAVDVIEVPGDHLSMIEDPANLSVLAERLRGYLESAA